MALFAYTASTPRAYPEFGFTAEVGDVADFGLVSMPNDGRWAAAAAGAVPTKTVGSGAPNYVSPAVPADGDVLVYDKTRGQYVNANGATRFATAPPTGTPTGYVPAVQADGSVAYQAQADVSAAAASAATPAVAAALAAGGVLTAATVPALGVNRVPDPQAKTSGASLGSAFTLARITTGLPAGIAYGLETTRTGTLSSVISQMNLGSVTSTDALRIPVTPGEVVSFSAMVWCDQAGAKVRLDIRWYDASGAQVAGSPVLGVYGNIAASTWETRTNSGLTVPATAAYAVPTLTFVTVSNGNTVTGAKARTTAATLVSGTTATSVYRDGSFTAQGWAWTGTAHASTSKKVLLAAGEFTTPTDVTTTATAVAKSAVAYVGPPRGLILPARLARTIPFTVNRLSTGYSATVDIESMHNRGAGSTLYVSPTGSNGNDGLTATSPKGDPGNAASAGGTYAPAELVVDGGIWTRAQCPTIGRPDLIIRPKDPSNPPIFLQADIATWTQHSGPTYKTQMTTTGKVFDRSANAPKTTTGVPIPTLIVASIQNVIDNPGTSYYDGTYLYFHAFDNRVPDNDCLVDRLTYHLNTATVAVASPHSIFVDGCEFLGGLYARLQAQMAGSQMLHRNAGFRYAQGNGIGWQGFKAVGIGSEATDNGIDGFNYHSVTLTGGTVVECEFLEVNCVGRRNGQDPTQTSCNGTTSHDNSRGTRVGGLHEFNPGPQVADVNNAVTANYGIVAGDCVGYPSTSTTPGPSQDFAAPADGTGIMYLIGAESRSSRALRGAEAARVLDFKRVGTIENQQGSTTDSQGKPVQLVPYV